MAPALLYSILACDSSSTNDWFGEPLSENSNTSSIDDTSTDSDASFETDADLDGEAACFDSYTSDCDCDDTDPSVNHSATEVADNGIDDDCDGVIDSQYTDDTTAPDMVDGEWSRITYCDDPTIYQAYSAFGNTQYVPLAVHILHNNDGSGGLSDVSDAEDMVTLANAYFEDLNVEFYINEQDEINNSDYNTLDDSTEKSDLLNSTYASQTGINVYVVDYYSSPGIIGVSTFPGYEDQGIVMISSAVNASNTAFTHELGHYFNLYHTHQGSGAELVARTNCTTQGDFLCETEADPAPYWVNSDDGCNYDTSTCQITSCGKDADGTEYQPNIGDVMGYYPNECKDESFAVEQQQMMLCTMQQIRTELEFESEPPQFEDSVGCTYSKYETIQEAIDSSSDGATIELCDSTFHETLALNGKSITLAAKDGHDAVVIDADDSSTAISATYSASTTSSKTLTLSGLTLTDGSNSTGAGILFMAENAGAAVNLVVNDCTIEDNTSTSSVSSTVYVILGTNGGSVTFDDVSLINNSQADYAVEVKGTDEDDATTLTVSGGEISDNDAGGLYASKIHEVNMSDVTVDSNGGKGIYLHLTPTATLDDVTVTDNNSGGMAFTHGDSILVTNSTVSDNTLAGADCSTGANWGAGIYVNDTYSSDMINVTIEDSSITDNNAAACARTNMLAGGIYVYQGTVTVDNTEILRNTSNTGFNAGGVGLWVHGDFTAVNSDFGTTSANNNSPADVAPDEDEEYNYSNNVSFTCDGLTGVCE